MHGFVPVGTSNNSIIGKVSLVLFTFGAKIGLKGGNFRVSIVSGLGEDRGYMVIDPL